MIITPTLSQGLLFTKSSYYNDIILTGYVDRCADRDIYMLHRGGGIGHASRPLDPSAYYVDPHLFDTIGYFPSDYGCDGPEDSREQNNEACRERASSNQYEEIVNDDDLPAEEYVDGGEEVEELELGDEGEGEDEDEGEGEEDVVDDDTPLLSL